MNEWNMIRISKRMLVCVCAAMFIAVAFPAPLRAACAVDEAKSEKTDSASSKGGKNLYEKTFMKDKTCVTAGSEDGFMKLHHCGKKLYIELPKKNFGRRMLIASTVTAVSNPEILSVGYKPVKPLHVRFERADSLTINLCEISPRPDHDMNDPAEIKAVERNSLDTVLETFSLFCESPDGRAVVFEAGSFFSGDNTRLGPVKSGTSNLVSTKYTLKKNSPIIEGVKAFSDNVSIVSRYTYAVNSDILGLAVLRKDEPYTIRTTRSILLLPEHRMRPRIADSRLGIFLSNRRDLNSDGDNIGVYSVIHRWDVQPSDTAAWLRGEAVEPRKHIVFYMDDAFPEKWKTAAANGILRWNSAFEEIGLKDVIQVRDFPADDPEFDPDNLKYSCIRYIPSTVANAMGPSWVDPETGEIINASILVYNDVVKLANGWRFCQTSQIDPRVRGRRMPEDVLDETMEYIVAHEMGHCLGFMHNMAASAAFPTDSLRSASFTQKYGTTPSIMDYARFNYVAQPQDEGVRLTPPFLGEYDRFLVKYAYCPVQEAATIRDDASVVEKWVDEKAGDPAYRYGRQQVSVRYDPSAIEEDLGDDPMKSSRYGIDNLKYILAHFNEWMDDSDDRDGTLGQYRYEQLVKQYYRYIGNVIMNVGGVYLYPSSADQDSPKAVAVPASVQRASLKWVIDEIRHSDWVSDRSVTGKFPIAIDKGRIVQFNAASDLFSTFNNVILSSHIASPDDAYTLMNWLDDIRDELFGKTWKKPSRAEMIMQKVYVATLISGADKRVSTAKQTLLSGGDDFLHRDTPVCGCPEDEREDSAFGKAGYNWQSKINLKSINNSRELFYGELLRLKNILGRCHGKTTRNEYERHYCELLRQIKEATAIYDER